MKALPERESPELVAPGFIEDIKDSKLDTPENKTPATEGQRRVHRRPRTARNEERHRLTKPRAEALAETIRAHWEALGIPVHVWVEPVFLNEWCVRSSLRLAGQP